MLSIIVTQSKQLTRASKLNFNKAQIEMPILLGFRPWASQEGSHIKALGYIK